MRRFHNTLQSLSNGKERDIKRRSTFAILFYITRTKIRKDDLCQLLCKVSIDAEAAQIGTKIAVEPAIWNPTTGRADGRSRNANEVNRAIDALTEEIKTHYKRINLSFGFVTAELIKNALKGIGQKPLTLLALFREHNEEFSKWVEIDRTKETYASYVRSYNRLRDFVQEKCGQEDITLRSLDTNFYDAFDLFLRTDCRMSQKTVHECFLCAFSAITLSSTFSIRRNRYRADEPVAVAKVFPGFTLVQDQAAGRFCAKSSLLPAVEAYFSQKSCRERIPNL